MIKTRLACTVLAAAFAASSTAQTWTQVFPGGAPSPRRAGAAAQDLINGAVMFYGGLLSPTAINGDTWMFDGTSWMQITPATPPPPRWGHRMVLDTWRFRLVTFGGRSPGITTTANDTWEWNGNDWAQVMTTNSPSPRAFYSMAFDDRRGQTVMFGAMSPFSGGETWEYDGVDWAQVVTPTTVASRETPAMCYDKGRGVTVMFGGWNSLSPGTMYNDTWEYDGTDWRQVTTATSPSGRYRAAFVYDDSRGRLVLYGGFGGGTALQDTWEFDGNDWTQVANTGPARSTEGYMAFDRLRGQSYFFGGSGPTGTSGDTWTYSGPQTAIFAPFGHGCVGSAGEPVLGGTPPRLGMPFSLTTSNLPGTAVGILIAQGFSNTTWNLGTQRLPFDLSVFGLTGCQMEVNPQDIAFVPASGGTAVLTFNVLNLPTLLGTQYFAQAFSPDTGAPNGIGALSNAGHGSVGN